MAMNDMRDDVDNNVFVNGIPVVSVVDGMGDGWVVDGLIEGVLMSGIAH